MSVTVRKKWQAILGLILIAGCQAQKAADLTSQEAQVDRTAEIEASLVMLSPEDQLLARQQKYCPVMPTVQLGEMGPPHKVDLKGQQAFVCCRNCLRVATEDPDATLTQLQSLKDATAMEPQQPQ